jgi:hypothetical protein
MPYFNVQITHESSSEYIVDAPNRETAEARALVAATSKKIDNKKVIRLRYDTASSTSVHDADKMYWKQALADNKTK